MPLKNKPNQTDDLGFLAKAPVRAESQLHNLGTGSKRHWSLHELR